MRTALASGTVMLLVMTAFIAANVPGEPQAPPTEVARTASQEQTKSATTTPPAASKRKISCKTPENASLCYWAHGRLSVWEGTPPFRLWKIGTRRILAIHNGPSRYPPRTVDDFENPEFPAELDRAYEVDNRRHKKATATMWAIPPPVFADFEICPLEPEHKA